MVVSTGPPAESVGAELDPVHERANVFAEVAVSTPLFAVPPSSWTLKLKIALLAEAVAVNCNLPAAMSATLTTWFVVTATPLYVIEPRFGKAVITTFVNAFPSISLNGKSLDLKVYVVEFSMPAGEVVTLLDVGASFTETTFTVETIPGFDVSDPPLAVPPLSLICVIENIRLPAPGASLSVFW